MRYFDPEGPEGHDEDPHGDAGNPDPLGLLGLLVGGQNWKDLAAREVIRNARQMSRKWANRDKICWSYAPTVAHNFLAVASQRPFCLFVAGDPFRQPIIATVYPPRHASYIPLIGKFVKPPCFPEPSGAGASVGEFGELLGFSDEVYPRFEGIARVVVASGQLDICPADKFSAISRLRVAEIDPPFVCVSTGDLLGIAKGPRLMDDLSKKMGLTPDGIDSVGYHRAVQALHEFIGKTFFGGT